VIDPIPRGPPLAVRTAAAIREALQSGLLSGSLPGERELASRLRVSRPVVRAALSQLASEGLVSVAWGKPSRATAGAPPEEVPETSRLLVLSPVPAGKMPQFATLWMEELRERMGASRGISMELCAQPSAFGSRPARVLQSLRDRNPDALWLLYLATGEMQRWFHRQALPCVLAGTCVPGVSLPSVDIDHRAACRHAGGMLLKTGCRRLALLLPAGELGGDGESEAGFREATALSRLPVPAPQIARHDGSTSGLRRELDRLLDQPQPVDGLLVARSHHALTALTHLLGRGIRLPEDMALISRDDDVFLEHTVPPVARYASDPVKFAEPLASLATRLARQRVPPPRPVRLIPELVPGGTLGKL
jgi:DNA-binding LacI/PurR family transcriptional regulator